MILVDTSVWIRKFLGRPGYAAELERILEHQVAGGHELVHGELIAGDSGDRAAMLRDYRLLPWAERLPHDTVSDWARKHKLCGCGLGWIDLHLLASAQHSGWQLWTADERLAAIASGSMLLGVRVENPLA